MNEGAKASDGFYYFEPVIPGRNCSLFNLILLYNKYLSLLYTKMLTGKSLQSDWVQTHKLSHNIVNFFGNIVISKRDIVMFIVYLFLIWND